MCNDPKWFCNLVMKPKPDYCKVGNGAPVNVIGQGEVNLVTYSNGKRTTLTLVEVLLIPGLTINLISVGKAAEKKLVAKFSDDCCSLWKATRLVLTAYKDLGHSNLYEIKIAKPLNEALVMERRRLLIEWHNALGHPEKSRLINTLGNLLGVELKTPNGPIECPTCSSGEGKAASDPISTKEASSIGERVHADLSGRVNKIALSGAEYYSLAKDEWSEFVFIFLLKQKSEVHLCLRQLVTLFEVRSGATIKEIWTDGGSEFVYDYNKLLFLREKIIHNTSSPYTPQQNGVIEREMGTITNMARTLLTGSKLGKDLWHLALESSVYLKNRLSTTKNKLTS